MSEIGSFGTDGGRFDDRTAKRLVRDLVMRFLIEHPEHARDVELRDGVNFRSCPDGRVEVLYPPIEDRPELVIGTLSDRPLA
jgi:hypothetical protein